MFMFAMPIEAFLATAFDRNPFSFPLRDLLGLGGMVVELRER